jgi:hypothetical protein
MDYQAFFFDTIRQTLQNHIAIIPASKYVNPIHYLKGQVVKSSGIYYFVSCTHSSFYFIAFCSYKLLLNYAEVENFGEPLGGVVEYGQQGK